MRPLSRDEKMWLCPIASTRRTPGPGRATTPFEAWQASASQGSDLGSFAPNGWMCNPPAGISQLWGRSPIEWHWRTANIRHANNVPVFTAGWWVDAWPRHTDEPPEYGDSTPVMGPQNQEVQRLCVNRHQGAQNCLFADWSVRKVGLKELWTLKWHREYDTTGSWTKAGGAQPSDWPRWMAGFRDY